MLLARLCESQDVKNMKNLFAVVSVVLSPWRREV